jgi:hypothetical protein
MTRHQSYREKAMQLLAQAQKESDPILRADGERLAASYLELAERLSGREEDEPRPDAKSSTDQDPKK